MPHRHSKRYSLSWKGFHSSQTVPLVCELPSNPQVVCHSTSAAVSDSSFSELGAGLDTTSNSSVPETVFPKGFGTVKSGVGPPAAHNAAAQLTERHSKQQPAQAVQALTAEQPGVLETPYHQNTPHNRQETNFTPAQDPSVRQLWPTESDNQAASAPATALARSSQRQTQLQDAVLSVRSESSVDSTEPPLTPLRDVSQPELSRLLAHCADVRQRLAASAGMNRAVVRDTHSLWRQLQDTQIALRKQEQETAEQTEHKALLLQYLRSTEGGEGGGSSDTPLALDALRGTALRAARQQLEAQSAELLRAQQQHALARLAQRQAQVHEAERSALLRELRTMSDQMAQATFVRQDEVRSAELKQEHAQRRQAGLEADLKTVLARAAQAEAFSKSATADLEHMQRRISEKNTALDELSQELRITNEALDIVKGALRSRSQELLGTRSRCDELQRTLDATSSGDVANLVSASSKAASLVQARYEAESGRLRREVVQLRAQLRDAQLKTGAVSAAARSSVDSAQRDAAAAAAAAGRQAAADTAARRLSALRISDPVAGTHVPASEACLSHLLSQSTQTTPKTVRNTSVECGPDESTVASPVQPPQLVDSGPFTVFQLESEQVAVPRTHVSQLAAGTQTAATGGLATSAAGSRDTRGVQTDETGQSSRMADLEAQLEAARERESEHARALERAAVIVEAVEAELDVATADRAEANRARARAQQEHKEARREHKDAAAEAERASALAMDLAVEVAHATAAEEQAQQRIANMEQRLKASRAQEVFLRLAWAGLARKAGAVATAASSEVGRLRGELEYAQEVNASLVSESATRTMMGVGAERGTPFRSASLSDSADRAALAPPTAAAAAGGARVGADDWAAVSSMLDAVSLGDSDSDSDFAPSALGPGSVFDGPMAQAVGPSTAPTADGAILASSTEAGAVAWRRALGHADSVSARSTAIRRSAERLQAMTAQRGLFGTPPRKASEGSTLPASADSSWHTAGGAGDV